ncbi:MAG: tRNA 2-thiocytidine(32) synthetase TtcA [Oscillospiraceae bacterium]|nr:tRNA 2-thiocytidine(32) synthetase TtcA [Oscillospiraceae bacterium]
MSDPNTTAALNKITGYVRRCIEDYKMIGDGETLAVAVSGGKDSLTLLMSLVELRRYYPKSFNLHAVTVDMGFENMDFDNVQKLCDDHDIPYTLCKTEFAKIVFDENRHSSHCSLCAKMRRGILHDTIGALGIRKIALGHHYDDAVETFLMSLLYEGRVNCFSPVTFLDRAAVTQIRPMLYVKEAEINKYASMANLPIVANVCPLNGSSKREEIKSLIKTLRKSYPDIKSKIFGSMQQLPIEGWKK